MSATDYYAELGIALPGGNGTEASVRCFANGEAHAHGDRMPSTSVNRSTGAWCCHGCGAKGGAYDAGIGVGLEPAAVMRLLEQYSMKTGTSSVGAAEKPNPTMPSSAEISRWTERLTDDDAQAALDTRGWDAATLARLGWGWDGRRVVIPVQDANGDIIGVGKYAPDASTRQGPKMLQHPGSARGLAPAPERVVRPGKALIVVEGEGDAASLACLGWPAIGVPGANYSWYAADTERVRRASHILLIPDADKVGRALMQDIAAALTDAWVDVRLLDLHPDREDGADLGDWLAAHEDRAAAKAELAALLRDAVPCATAAADEHVVEVDRIEVSEQQAEVDDDVTEDPFRNLSGDLLDAENRMARLFGTSRAFRPGQWPEAPFEAFYGLAGRLVMAVERQTEADPMGVLINLLSLTSAAIGPSPHVVISGSERHSCAIWSCVVGSTSTGRKGTAHGLARYFVLNADPSLRGRILSGLGSGEGLIWSVRDATTSTDADGNEMIVDPGTDDKRAVVRESEFASTLRKLGSSGSIISPVLRAAWDGTDLMQTVKNSPARASGAHVVLCVDITGEELKRELSATEIASGLANRLCFVIVRRSKELPDGGDIDWSIHQPLLDELGYVISAARARGRVLVDDSFREVYRAAYPALTSERFGLYGAATTRAAPMVYRLSLLYCLLENANAINGRHCQAALALWRYCEESAAFIFGRKLGQRGADEILRLLSERPEGMTRTEIREERGKNSGFAEDLDLLEHQGLARRVSEPTGGRPVERWFLADSTTPPSEKPDKPNKPAQAKKPTPTNKVQKDRKGSATDNIDAQNDNGDGMMAALRGGRF